MSQVYKTEQISSALDFALRAKRGDLPSVSISNTPWGGDYLPTCSATLSPDYENKGLRVLLSAEENLKDIRALATDFNGPVWEDSCLEFFFNPCPDEGLEYINFELNSIGAMLCGIHTKAHEGFLQGHSSAEFELKVLRRPLSEELLRWSVDFFIPFDFIKTYFPSFKPQPGMEIAGNFYKCGDSCPTPHHLAWAPITWPSPNFHLPEYFGRIVL